MVFTMSKDSNRGTHKSALETPGSRMLITVAYVSYHFEYIYTDTENPGASGDQASYPRAEQRA